CVQSVESTPAETSADLRRVHRVSYVELVRSLREGFLDPETAVHRDTFDIGLLAVGGVLLATRSAVRDGHPSIALVRPPGHHAGPGYGGGLCFLNYGALVGA